ncbi:MAG: CHC2 zinc finger domain-containing protein [Magnetococcus sp. DMHC-8]
MAHYPDSFIEEVRERADVLDVVGRHVRLKKQGANWLGLCPFHGEKTPSFSVRPDQGFYKCFGCGAGGGCI